jgi:hypothetical protein
MRVLKSRAIGGAGVIQAQSMPASRIDPAQTCWKPKHSICRGRVAARLVRAESLDQPVCLV